jgi:predicted TIM-barrel fold metal-dependent hydrolase
MKRIAIEEHFWTEEYVSCLKSKNDPPPLKISKDAQGNQVEKLRVFMLGPGVFNQLMDVGEGRLKQMAEDGIDMQVLSLMNPGSEIFDTATCSHLAKSTNNELSKIISKYPNKFAGFAALPMLDPDMAAKELERAVKDLGLKGAKINSNVRGEFLDNQKYWVILEKAEELGVPIYLHPNAPPPDMIKPYLTYVALSGSMLAFAHETSLHAMRLICGGIFDRFPRLKIILGHLGEALPFWLGRINTRWKREAAASDPISNKIKKLPGDYIKENFLVTTSGILWPPALMCTYLALGADKILFSIDYPCQANRETIEFIDATPICDNDKEKIYHKNAEILLGL